MFGTYKNHPFRVKGYLRRSIALTYAFPKEELQSYLPPHLELDCFQDTWAFVTIAFVETEQLRPFFLPPFMGNNFLLIGYRIFVRYTNTKGKRLRGLYIIESTTNSKKMASLSKLFTRYNFGYQDIRFTAGNPLEIVSVKGNIVLRLRKQEAPFSLPKDSVFSSMKEARRFQGPLPFTFHYDSEKKQMIRVQGVRPHWEVQPLEVIEARVPKIAQLGKSAPMLSNAFLVADIPYQWNKGIVEQW